MGYRIHQIPANAWNRKHCLDHDYATKQDEELELWFADVEANADVGRVVRALRLSAMPPKAGVPFPPALGAKLGAAATAALGPDDPADRWIAVLEAAALVELDVPPVVVDRALVVDRAGSDDVSVELEDDSLEDDSLEVASGGWTMSRPEDDVHAASDDATVTAIVSAPAARARATYSTTSGVRPDCESPITVEPVMSSGVS